MKGLKVVTWNCQRALGKKLREIASLSADIIALQECSLSDAKLLKTIGLELACWAGSNPNSGLALAAKPRLALKARPVQGIQWAIQGATTTGRPLGVVATWACKSESSKERYIRQIHKLLDGGVLEDLPPKSLVLGDFNSNSIWDSEHRERNHTRATERFEAAGFLSAYHDLRGESKGAETIPTFYLYRKLSRGYHIDYAFLSSNLRKVLKGIQIGEPKVWLKHSDHMPFSLDFQF